MATTLIATHIPRLFSAAILCASLGCMIAPSSTGASGTNESSMVGSSVAHLASPMQVSAAAAPRKMLLVHYMPWFESKPTHENWGWHWTMGHADPNRVTAGRRDAASRAYPLIGLYDSADPDALQCQVMLMKLAGIDGVIIDWYGIDDVFDYASVNRNTQQLIPILEQAGLKFAICYEPQTVPTAIKAGKFAAPDAVAHGQRLIVWMQQHLFCLPMYLRLDGRPVLLAFGDPYYTDSQWNSIFSILNVKPQFVTENDRREPSASVGGFDWPAPGSGTAGVASAQSAFQERSQKWPVSISAAYPRFDDFYAQAGVGKSYGAIDDQDGETYEATLKRALSGPGSIVQLVTWNDWGEGTQIEPSIEYGYRDLETTQRLRHRFVDNAFTGQAADLRLPIAWYLLQKEHMGDPAARAKLAKVVPLVFSGRLDQARAVINRYK